MSLQTLLQNWGSRMLQRHLGARKSMAASASVGCRSTKLIPKNGWINWINWINAQNGLFSTSIGAPNSTHPDVFLTPLRRALGSATCDAACIASNHRRRRQCCGRAVGPADVTAEGISESLPNESGFLKIVPPIFSRKQQVSFSEKPLRLALGPIGPWSITNLWWLQGIPHTRNGRSSWAETCCSFQGGWFLHIEPGKWQRILFPESQWKEAHRNAKRNMPMLAQPDCWKSWHTYPNFCSQLQVTPRRISMQQTSASPKRAHFCNSNHTNNYNHQHHTQPITSVLEPSRMLVSAASAPVLNSPWARTMALHSLKGAHIIVGELENNNV